MTSLLELEQDRSSLVEQILSMMELSESGEADPGDTLAALDELEKQIAGKADAIAAMVAVKKAEIAYLKEREEAYRTMRIHRENALKRFEDYIKGILQRREESTITGKSAKLSLVKNGGKAPLWIDETVPVEKFPAEFVTEKVTLSLDKEAIRASLDEKGELKFNGALLAEELPRTYRLKITG
jgi:hypothetical protein